MNAICLALFSPVICYPQCCEVKIHFAITSGEQLLPVKNNKSFASVIVSCRFYPEKVLYFGGSVLRE